MLHAVLFILIIQCVFVLCLNGNETYYCIVNGSDHGVIVLVPKIGKDDTNIGSASQYLDNTTAALNLTEKNNHVNWTIFSSTDNYSKILSHPVLDQRWETFINTHDHLPEINTTLFSNTTVSTFFSVRFSSLIERKSSSPFVENKWYHLMLNDSKLYSCDYGNMNSTSNKTELWANNGKIKEPFKDYYRLIWKLHKFVIGAACFIYFYRLYNKKGQDARNEGSRNQKSVKMKNDDTDTVQLLNPRYDSIISTSNDNWAPIRSSDFAPYVREVLDPKEKSNDLPAQFSALPSGYLRKWNEGKKPENIEKNRYAKICPYDDNRVKLEKNLGDQHQTTDYINASYVQGFNSAKEYIVTQNPLENTVIDFWRMIWQEKVEYVIMISSNNETFHCYWPELKTTEYFGDIEIYLEKVRQCEFFNHRVLLMRRYGQTREVVQLHFHAWSQEMLTPHIFLDFMNNLLMIPHHFAPIVFHCLAGVGRSATILLCDIALRAVAVTGSYNLYAITKQLRHCRADMVQNLRQYQLAHLIILESLNYKDKGIEINEDFEAHFSRLFEGNIIKKMWSEYLENKEWIYEAVTPSTICSKYPKRNRYTDDNLLPVEHSRVTLLYKQPDYIHAMYVYNYNQSKNIIVAQQPSPSTLSDFWIMVLQNHVTTIINLNELDSLNTSECYFFPTHREKILKLRSNITIKFNAEEENLNYDKMEVTVYSEGKIRKNMCIINVKNWPKIKAVPDSTDIVTSIWDITMGIKKKEDVPILICCDDGIRASSLVACFFYMVDKMIQERKCDVVGAVRAVRRTRTVFINFEQFVFLHHSALAFFRDFFKQYHE